MYVARLQRAATEDAELAATFVRVTGPVDPPSALLRPEVVARVAESGPPPDVPTGLLDQAVN